MSNTIAKNRFYALQTSILENHNINLDFIFDSKTVDYTTGITVSCTDPYIKFILFLLECVIELNWCAAKISIWFYQIPKIISSFFQQRSELTRSINLLALTLFDQIYVQKKCAVVICFNIHEQWILLIFRNQTSNPYLIWHDKSKIRKECSVGILYLSLYIIYFSYSCKICLFKAIV